MKLARTAGLSLVDQGIASASNLLVVVVAARNLGANEFGLFALAMLLYTVLVPAVHAVVGQELQLRVGTHRERRRASASAILASIALGAICGLSLLILALFALESAGPVYALALCLPLLAAQEVLRGAAVVCDAVHVALLSDGLWLGLSLALTAVVETGLVKVTPTTAVLAWGVAGSLSAAAVVRFFFRWGAEPGVRYRHRSFVGYRFLFEFLLMRATSQALILALGVIAGLASLGSYRGATSLLGPLTVGVLSIANFGAPLAARADRRSWSRLAGWGSVVVLFSVTLYTSTLLLVPEQVGHALLGDSWDGARELLLPLAIMTACTGVSAILASLVRLLEPTRTLTARLITAASMPPLFMVGYWLGGVAGAAWGLAAATALQTGIMAAQYRRLNASIREPAHATTLR